MTDSSASSHSGHISGVLVSYGLSATEADSTIRVSFCADNTKEEVDALCDALRSGIAGLVKIK